MERTPIKMTLAQFIVSAVTGVAVGQKAKNQRGRMKHTATMLITSPNLPSDHLRGGNGAPYRRRQIRHPMTTK